MAPTPPNPLPGNYFRGLRNIFNGALASVLNTLSASVADKLPLGGGTLTGPLTVTGTPARISVNNPSNVADRRTWRWECGGDVASMYAVTDAGVATQLMAWDFNTVRFTAGITLSGSNLNCDFNLITNCANLLLKASGGAPTVDVSSGTGVPVTTPANGSLFLRTDGGAGSTLYIREGGAWVAK